VNRSLASVHRSGGIDLVPLGGDIILTVVGACPVEANERRGRAPMI
jgi:hypothetical protein